MSAEKRNRDNGAADERYMRRAIALARRGVGLTSPNPAVGAVVVKNGRALATGYHKKAGAAHAELAALRSAGARARGATLYVTLEPCPNYGRTPPCTDAIIEAGIRRVVVGARDVNPAVNGRGIRRLRRAGIAVSSGLLADECRAINRPYEKLITTGLPYVILKLASTLDGRIATKTGRSKWITSAPARRRVHELRETVDCVMVGRGTVTADNPRLTARAGQKRRAQNPSRAVLDPRLDVLPGARVFAASTGGERVFVFAGPGASKARARGIEAAGGEVIRVRETKNGLSLRAVLKELGKRHVASVMVEGGSALAAGFLKERLVDRVLWFAAPVIFGADALASVGELGVRSVAGGVLLRDISVTRIGRDILVEGRLGGS